MHNSLYTTYSWSWALVLLMIGCNAHPVTPINANLNAVDRINNRLPAKTKLDFLFVVDNSNSMCEEQARLADDFKLFSAFLFDELQGSADYRIAVTSTDLGGSGVSPQGGYEPGELLYMPAIEPQSCQAEEYIEYIPDTADCEPPGTASAIISSTQLNALTEAELPPGEDRSAQLKAELERQFRCRATLGTSGGSMEKGLEAMRQALSCRGPNAELFSTCCVNGGTEEAYYNPACTPSSDNEPEFLRPDATLIVIIISDEDDCSTPSDAPLDTGRLICRAGGMSDGDGDGVPDLYSEFCSDPQDCYQRECGSYTEMGPATCYEARCQTDALLCDQTRGALSSIREYKDFLYGLKARPYDQLLVAPLVGFRSYTELGALHRYVEGPLMSMDCAVPSSSSYGTEACCPMGICTGLLSPIEACHIPERSVRASAGTRYLELADLLGVNALGCPTGEEPSLDPETGEFNVTPSCINLCSDDLTTPLTAIKGRVAELMNTYCLDRSPPCIVSEEGGKRRCEGTSELQDPSHYELTITISCSPGRCEEGVLSRTLDAEEWTLRIDTTGCPAQVILNELPPAGADVVIEFISASDALVSEP